MKPYELKLGGGGRGEEEEEEEESRLFNKVVMKSVITGSTQDDHTLL